MSLQYPMEKQPIVVLNIGENILVRTELYTHDDKRNNNIVDPSLYELTEVYAIPMSVRTNIISNNNIEKTRKTVRPPNNISDHLSTGEKQSIFAYLGNRARALNTGVCQLVQSENEEWKETKTGIICYIKDYNTHKTLLSLIEPNDNGTPAKVLWIKAIGIDFETRATSHPHFVIFVVETSSREVYGLNFYDVEEARSFHETVTTQRIIKMERRENRMMSQGNIPKRRAPSPPKIGLMSQRTPSPENDELIQSSAPSREELVDIKKKEKKDIGGLFGFLTIRRKKKKRANIQISEPTDFHHLEHIGLDSLSPDQKETFSELVQEVDVQFGNVEQLTLLKEIVTERSSEIRSSIRIKRNSIRPTELFVRGQPSALADTRSSLMFSNKQQRRTPREIKKGSTNKKNEYDNLQFNPVTFKSNSTYDDLLNPDWDSAPVYDIPYNSSFLLEPAPQCEQLKIEQPMTDKPTQDESRSTILLEAPPVPKRESSKMGRTPLGRRQTPPLITRVDSHLSTPIKQPPPRLPLARKPSQHKMESDDTTGNYNLDTLSACNSFYGGLPLQTPHYPIDTLATPIRPTPPLPEHGKLPDTAKSSIPPAPPPPPPNLLSSSVIPTSITPSPTPPSSPSSLLSKPNVLPVISNERKSFLEEIHNVDKTKLRSVSNNRSPSSTFKMEDSPSNGLLDSIQKQLDSRRIVIASSSSEDDSSDSEWSD